MPKFNYVLLLLTIAFSSLAQDNQLTSAEKSAGWQLLFNGKDMSQWRNFKASTINEKWVIKNNAMYLSAKGGGDLMTKKAFENFELTLDWQISIGGNSGIFILADELGEKIYSHAVEVQVLDNERHSDNKYNTHLSGSVYDLIGSPAASHKIAGEWNNVRILLKNKVLKVWQNDVLTADIVIHSQSWNDLVSASKFKNWSGFAMAKLGHIGLQDHDDPVAYKNIKIREIN